MSDLWLAVLFSNGSEREPANILGLFDTKEAAVERVMSNYINRFGKTEWSCQNEETDCVDIGYMYLNNFEVTAQAFKINVNEEIRIEI